MNARPNAGGGVPNPVFASKKRHGIARVLSKAGLCSRSEATRWVQAGRVSLDGRVVRDPDFPVVHGIGRIAVDGVALDARERVYVMLNKPRGLVTTASDEHGRATVYDCLQGDALPWLAPVGRLDQASEGLLLFSNDPEWAARIANPDTGPDKVYHVQVDTLPDTALLTRLMAGCEVDGDFLSARQVRLLRQGQKNAWLEITLEEGRNRQIRRLLASQGVGVLRLLRVAIGDLVLGDLGKGKWRHLTDEEVSALAR